MALQPENFMYMCRLPTASNNGAYNPVSILEKEWARLIDCQAILQTGAQLCTPCGAVTQAPASH